MKKTLTYIISLLIAGAILFGFLSIFAPFWVCAYLYFIIMPIMIFAYLFNEYVTIKNIKKIFFWIKYKRVPEKQLYSCENCVFEKVNNIGKYKCEHEFKILCNRTIFAKRSFKLFTLLAVIILFASCTTYNNCIIIQDKIVVPDTLQTEKYLFDF